MVEAEPLIYASEDMMPDEEEPIEVYAPPIANPLSRAAAWSSSDPVATEEGKKQEDDEDEENLGEEEVTHQFDERLLATIAEDPSIFTVLATNLPGNSFFQIFRASGSYVCGIVCCRRRSSDFLLLVASSILAVFIMLVLPLQVALGGVGGVKCRGDGKLERRVTAVALIAYLAMTEYGTLLEARLFSFFATLAPYPSNMIFAATAIFKIAGAASVVVVTAVLFLLEPRLAHMLLTTISLRFLLEVDRTIVRVFKPRISSRLTAARPAAI